LGLIGEPGIHLLRFRNRNGWPRRDLGSGHLSPPVHVGHLHRHTYAAGPARGDFLGRYARLYAYLSNLSRCFFVVSVPKKIEAPPKAVVNALRASRTYDAVTVVRRRVP